MNKILTITKTDFINYVRCHKMLWLNKNKKKISKEMTASEKLNIEEGHIVGMMATNHSFHKDGVLIETLDKEKSLEQTLELLKNENCEVIYESAFNFLNENNLNLFLRADILKKKENSFELIEVKSSTSVQETHYWDIAFQVYVLLKNKIDLSNVYLMKPNKEYIRKTNEVNLNEFFEINSVMEIIKKDYLPKVEELLLELNKELRNPIEPKLDIGSHCKKPWLCPNYDYCKKRNGINEDSIEKLTRLSSNKREFYKSKKIKYINQISEEVIHDYRKEFKKDLLSDKQEIQVSVSKNGIPFVDKKALENFFSELVYPLFHLDFEAYNRSIPPYMNMKVNQFLTFQASIHKEENYEQKLKKILHFEFLQEDDVDPRLEMIEFLLKNLEKKGSIIVYNKSFEESRIKEMGESFPSFKEELLALNSRLVDLEVPFKSMYYSHDFAGSSSIKKVLPSLVPELSYDRLNIQNGADAQAIFRSLIQGKFHDKDKNGNLLKGKKFNKIKKDLLDYCSLDTYAMVVLLRKLKEICNE